MTRLYCTDHALEGRAADLAVRWGFARGEGEPGEEPRLVLTAERLELRALHSEGPVYVDFVGGAVGHRRRFGGGRGQEIAKAVGLKKGATPSVLDATAGLGRDAFVLASLGCPVTLIERSPVVAALLEDGLARAQQDAEVAPITARMQLLCGNAAQLMAQLEEVERPDVVYLDPMYPHRRKSALVKKEMRLFREVVGEDPDADVLLPAALAAARQRVVVKRPDYAEPMAGRKPTLSIATKNHRFDVYVLKALAQ
ncbi:MAG: 16S rRNA methyltransferase [Gammaproteobacteria bacterium HGW-Gammaproteobacteria-1]|jgi:16S rRNA (guanine1516-N2)-methyltransferase|nr:MAG: 16S rRNA methyltransferase [Gammaproteobacteria bacterium HGW-Gammaproteobacteria-1]